MSIYATRLVICDDPDSGMSAPIAYMGSHVRIAEDAWRYGSVQTAHIPPWCAHGVNPDSFEGDEDDPPIPFLRLSVDSYDWRKPEQEAAADVVLDRDQVSALRDDLTAWLAAVDREGGQQ